MEREMLNIIQRDKKRSGWIRNQTKVYDAIKSVKTEKVDVGRTLDKKKWQQMDV